MDFWRSSQYVGAEGARPQGQISQAKGQKCREVSDTAGVFPVFGGACPVPPFCFLPQSVRQRNIIIPSGICNKRKGEKQWFIRLKP